MRLLVIEDEFPMRIALVKTLQAEGYRVVSAVDGPGGLESALTEKVDLILLDVMLPGLDGYALCREIRQRGLEVPVLMLTARGQVQDRVNGLDCGADDYLVKPFSMKELLARVRALLRRQSRSRAIPDELQLGELQFDLRTQNATREGRAIELSTREWDMLKLLIAAKGEPVVREQFLDEVWEYNAWPTTRIVDNFIAKLRAKVEPNPTHPDFIVTVRGVGYKLQMGRPNNQE
ncbi:MAG: DNA-binding response OmpR family regulator [Akkermansiaceae bacterium]|jgi:DNA-binding response OmpR family regulator